MATTSPKSLEPSAKTVLKYSSFRSQLDPAFWFELSHKKLNEWKLDTELQKAYGIYASALYPTVSGDGTIELSNSAFEPSLIPKGYAAAIGWIKNFNTVLEWREQKLDFHKDIEKRFTELITTKNRHEILQNPALLVPFYISCYANLKKYEFQYHFSFPSLRVNWQVESRTSDPVVINKLVTATQKYMEKEPPEQRGFFIIVDPDNTCEVKRLEFLESAKGQDVVIGYLNPSSSSEFEGQPLKNLLSFLAHQPNIAFLLSGRIFSYSPYSTSSILNVSICQHSKADVKFEWHWELDFSGQKRIPRTQNLSSMMDSKRRIAEARDLNNHLMKWRVAEGINLDIIKEQKALILGMGTLGCIVVRTLMAWGVNKFRLVDNGVVSFSNPARQNFYTFDDCVAGNLKVDAAAAAMKKIDPSVEVEVKNLTIPMPEHPASFVEEDLETLRTWIDWSTVVFLLVDTREARWLPTLLATASPKLVINAAIGFDSFVVMRHGLPGPNRLGCYFCSDIVSPQNSTDNATLDQQCTVTRPGVASITSAIAVELFVTLLQHKEKEKAPVEEAEFGTTAHQIRGQMSNWQETSLTGSASPYCAGCGDGVVKAYNERGDKFVREVCQRGGSKVLENVSGLAEAKKGFEDGWDGDDDMDEEDDW